MDNLAQLLKKYSGLKLDIAGYTDAKGSSDYNQQLSINRANAVSKYLSSAGIDQTRFTINGLSESDPVACNQTKDKRDSPEGRKLNRRVQFGVSPIDGVTFVMEEVVVPDHLKLDV